MKSTYSGQKIIGKIMVKLFVNVSKHVYYKTCYLLYISGTWEQGDEAAEDFFQRVSFSTHEAEF